MEYLVRFLIGGIVVSTFAVLGDLFKPKSFAGLFGAAPSVALATLGMAIAKHGGPYAAIEGRSMLLGGVALFVYCQFNSWLAMRARWHALPAACLSLTVWLGLALGLWRLLIK